MDDLEKTIEISTRLKNISVIGLHFHIGSQILDMDDFKALSNRPFKFFVSIGIPAGLNK